MLTVRASLEPDQRVDFEHALSPIMVFLSSRLARESKGAAAFSRAGETPYLRILPLHVPVPNHLSVDAIPNLFRLIALKDAYHRYIVLIAHRDRARILEVDVGAITREIWTKRPELHDVEVEVLRESDALIGIGGVGCLLKYRRPDQYV
ncbi:MAG: hypothetical protein KAI97_08755 [Gemmatimonadetes bacterium]|nr:hypothetical protein [Gemmatimonadota bacterium]